MLLELGVERPPVWLSMEVQERQSYQISCEKQPSFRERSENGDLVVEVTLQPWNVLSSTFWDIVGGKSHVLFNPLRTADLAREFAPESSVHMNTIPS
uniref:Uncharacterized protein n=1 Tax=Salix viminalis TaxID=40686 RepID=A0A6N2KK95_SALVM